MNDLPILDSTPPLPVSETSERPHQKGRYCFVKVYPFVTKNLK
ncbi:hypothetical protein VT03_27335 [Planctomyces sp. SH-PL14]|nr:hypothetical protein VT03_27335 [Planctomyces sp. SH-PL14]